MFIALLSAGAFAENRAGAQGASGNPNRTIAVQFVDSATGYSVNAAEVTANMSEIRIEEGRGKAELNFLQGKQASCALAVRAQGYWPASGTVVSGNGRSVRFLLDPIAPPPELRPEHIDALRRADATIFLGFVVDDDSGVPLSGVRVTSNPSGVETQTDGRGFFQLAVPLPWEPGAASSASLHFEKPDHISQEYHGLELWPNGDWTYPIRLQRGQGKSVTDENQSRRRPNATISRSISAASQLEHSQEPGAVAPEPSFSMASSSNLTIRVPRTIRVLLTNGTIEYVSMELYCRRSLPQEWFASWNGYAGGSNSLKAGAVAVRTYAIGYVNFPRGSDHDICATTACQVYRSTTSSSTDTAVNQTTGYVMAISGASIPRGLTEYSSENNQLGMACGDGFTAPASGCLFDPVCTGEPEFGHGRGMCQWGSVKWATGLKFPGNSFFDTTSTNGQPRRDWIWILQHYYPDLTLIQGTPLVIGDNIKVIGTSALSVRMCADGGISNGVACPQVGSKTSGALGTIIDGPVQVISDGIGYTWWKIQWNDNLIGWSAENWLERSAPIPPPPPPVLAPIADAMINEGQALTFTATATASDNVLLTDFESFGSSSPNGTILFRQPTFSGSTAPFLDASPNLSIVTGSFPGGNPSTRALQVNWSFNTNAWMRLTTFGAASLPNPVIDFSQKLRFDIHTDRTLRLGVGLRETTNAAGTALGSDGGTLGGIEWAGVTNRISGQPQPTRTIAAGSWTTLTFDFPAEAITNYASGNGLLSTASGLGVLEHLAFVPADGTGTYNVYLDNFTAVRSRRLTFSLDPGAPTGASINPTNGLFAWTPTEAQGPGTNMITVRVTDDGTPSQSATETFNVVVHEINLAPVLAAISNQIIHAGTTLRLTNSATDPDIPANARQFNLTNSPVGAVIGSASGVFTWITSDALAGTSNNVTVRVTDNGVPPLSDERTFAVLIVPRPNLLAASGTSPGSVVLTWSAIAGKRYRIQYKTDLNESLWTDLGPPVTATGAMAMETDTPGTSQRFYRILVE